MDGSLSIIKNRPLIFKKLCSNKSVFMILYVGIAKSKYKAGLQRDVFFITCK